MLERASIEPKSFSSSSFKQTRKMLEHLEVKDFTPKTGYETPKDGSQRNMTAASSGLKLKDNPFISKFNPPAVESSPSAMSEFSL